jgi:hypothetical protein
VKPTPNGNRNVGTIAHIARESEMTDLKMCIKGELRISLVMTDYHGAEITEDRFIDTWVPIEPQPSCGTCRFYDIYPYSEKEEGSCSEILKWVEPMGYTSHLDVDKNFCCNGWKAKK